METKVYTIVYGGVDYEYYLSEVQVEGTYSSLEKAKKALVEIVKSNFEETLAELGDNALDDHFSEDGMKFIDGEIGESSRLIWKIEENILTTNPFNWLKIFDKFKK